MAMIRKTITVTEQQGKWIKARAASSEYANESEYIRELIQHHQVYCGDVEAIRAELIKGEQSGEPQPFDFDEFKERMLAKYGDPLPKPRTGPGSRTGGPEVARAGLPVAGQREPGDRP